MAFTVEVFMDGVGWYMTTASGFVQCHQRVGSNLEPASKYSSCTHDLYHYVHIAEDGTVSPTPFRVGQHDDSAALQQITAQSRRAVAALAARYHNGETIEKYIYLWDYYAVRNADRGAERGEIFVVLHSEALAEQMDFSNEVYSITVTGWPALDHLLELYQITWATYQPNRWPRTIVFIVDRYSDEVWTLVERLNALAEVEVAHYVSDFRTEGFDPHELPPPTTHLTRTSWGALKATKRP